MEMNTIRWNFRLLRTSLLAMLAMGYASVAWGASLTENSWNPRAAADYLDQRARWWILWPDAARDQGTFCVSCHTVLPYALSRPVLGRMLGEGGPVAGERQILESVRKRVRLWNEFKPFYSSSDGVKNRQSRGTESILNALILASVDARSGRLTDDTRIAFRNMWALQEISGIERGAWPWLNFGNEPFEATDSRFYGACLAAVAIGTAPQSFSDSAGIQERVKALTHFLNSEYTLQALINQITLLWASAKLPGLLGEKQRASLEGTVLGNQRADGGWSLSSLAWTWRGSEPKSLLKLWFRSEDNLLEAKSDGYATGLIALALEQTGFPRNALRLQRAMWWLRHNQSQSDGRWPGYSLNHPRIPAEPVGLFMSDAATAYAVLALAYDQGR